MRLIVLSDTHGFHRGMGHHGNAPVPDGDVLVHCGDFSRDFGSWMDVVRFAAWMKAQPHAHKILCPGNHDYGIHEHPAKAEALFRDNGVHMLGQKSLEVGGLVFDGGPWMPISGWEPRWGFEMEEHEREREWSRIERVDVLVTHTPPMGVLDQTAKGQNIGCTVLRRRVFDLRPQLHCFGHVHEARGSYREQGITFLNASSNTRSSYVRDEVNGITHMTMSVRDAYVYDVTPRST